MKLFILFCTVLITCVSNLHAQTSNQIKADIQNPAILAMREVRINPADTVMLKQNFPQNGSVWFKMDSRAKIYTREERDSIMQYIKSVQPTK